MVERPGLPSSVPELRGALADVGYLADENSAAAETATGIAPETRVSPSAAAFHHYQAKAEGRNRTVVANGQAMA